MLGGKLVMNSFALLQYLPDSKWSSLLMLFQINKQLKIIMISKIKTSYRLCLKQLNILKSKDKKLAQFILNVVKQKKDLIKTYKEAEDLSKNLAILLTNISSEHPQNQKYLLKSVRIFTNNSLIVTNKLQFRQSYLQQVKNHLENDLQYQQLSEKDKLYVMKVVQLICKRPLGKFKTVGKYLGSASSQRQEFQMINDIKEFQLKSGQDVLSQNSPFLQIMNKLSVKKQQKIHEMVRQLYENKIFLL